jgi:hypothetical protein
MAYWDAAMAERRIKGDAPLFADVRTDVPDYVASRTAWGNTPRRLMATSLFALVFLPRM